ncbi:hypothetical protein GCM10010234_19870 [Streptomyces hawaiiensis]|uniref:LD-carboxypeptidase n=1 Tax=Streptomyces hawaiiensis TaxID=67305 RepID=UPI0031E19AD6
MTSPTSPAYPPKPSPGDRIAVISPSSGPPGLFPLPYELGLERLREEFGLEPVEYPATRTMGSTPQERADDIHAAFTDPGIKAVIASIGGDDQITVLPYLDRELIRADPKPFFGMSDNTNLLAFLRTCGVVGFHGGSVMCELGRPGGVLLLETSEDMPSATEVFRTLRGMGERGLLGRFSALLMGRPRTWSFERPNTPEEATRYAADQREAVLRAMRTYAPGTTVVLDVDFGHTDPQLVIPYGGTVRVNGPARRITVTY